MMSSQLLIATSKVVVSLDADDAALGVDCHWY